MRRFTFSALSSLRWDSCHFLMNFSMGKTEFQARTKAIPTNQSTSGTVVCLVLPHFRSVPSNGEGYERASGGPLCEKIGPCAKVNGSTMI
jgi:hypothetical protein